jgi:hypothetical protein
MPDSETSAALGSLLEELRKSVSRIDTRTRTNAAAELLETVEQGTAVAGRRQDGRKAAVADPDHVALAEALDGD